jgi:hypothetical protein
MVDLFNRAMMTFNSMPVGIKATTFAIGALTAAIPLLTLALVSLEWTLGKLGDKKNFEGIFGMLRFLKNPWVLAGIAALGVGALAVEDYTTYKRGGKAVTGDVNKVAGGFQNTTYALSWTMEMLQGATFALKNDFYDLIKGLSLVFRGFLEGDAGALVTGMKDIEVNIFALIFDVAGTVFYGSSAIVGGMVLGFFEWLVGWMKEIVKSSVKELTYVKNPFDFIEKLIYNRPPEFNVTQNINGEVTPRMMDNAKTMQENWQNTLGKITRSNVLPLVGNQ